MTSSAPRAAVRALLVVALLAPLTGCVSFEMGRIKRDVARDLQVQQPDVEVGGGFAMGFGRISLGLARFTTWVAAPNSTRAARHLARHVHSVKVGRWSVRGAVDGRALAAPPAFERRGWTPFVTVRDTASTVWVYLRERRDGRLTGLLTAVLAGDDLVLTKVSGNLSGLVLDAVEMGQTGGVLGDALRQAGMVRDEAEPAPPGSVGSGAAPPAPQAAPATAGDG